MELVFDDEAIADLENIYSWIATDSPSAAKKLVQRLFSSRTIDLLPVHGRAGREPDTFEWVVPRLPYIVIYEVDRVRECITITAVLHGAQDRES